MHRQLLLVVVGLAASVCGTLSAQVARRTWTATDGTTTESSLSGTPAKEFELGKQPAIFLNINGRPQRKPYDYFITDDLIWLFQTYPYTEKFIAPVVRSRVQKSIDDNDFDEVVKVLRDLPFMSTFIDEALTKSLEGDEQLDVSRFEALHRRFKDLQASIEKALDTHVNDPSHRFNLETLQRIATSFPKLRPAVIAALKRELANPREFFAKDKIEGQGNQNQYLEEIITALEKICKDFPELRKDAESVAKRLLDEPANSRFFDDDLILDRMHNSFPSIETSIHAALVRSIVNPVNLDATQKIVYVDSFGKRFSEDEVTPWYGGYVTYQGHHPVRPRMVLSTDHFNRARIDTIKTRWPKIENEIILVIQRELENTARRWPWLDLLELTKSYPAVQKDVENTVARDLKSPNSLYKGIDLAEIAKKFPALQKDVEAVITLNLLGADKYTPKDLVAIVQQFPNVRDVAEKRLRTQMDDPVFNKEFENLDILDNIVQSFPGLKGSAVTVLTRMIENPMRSGDAKSGGKPDLDLARAIAARFSDALDEVEAAYGNALKGTLVTWSYEELLELKKILPNLEPVCAEAFVRELKGGVQQYSIPELYEFVEQFPSAGDQCASMILAIYTNPKSYVRLNDIYDLADRFPAVKEKCGSTAMIVLKRQNGNVKLDDLYTVSGRFPSVKDECAGIALSIVKDPKRRFDVTDLQEVAMQFPSIKEQCASIVLAYVKSPKNKLRINSLIDISQRFPTIAKDMEKEIDNAIEMIVDGRYYIDGIDYYHNYNGRMIEIFSRLMRENPDQKELIIGIIYRRVERIFKYSDELSVKEWYNNFKDDLPYDERFANALAQKTGIFIPPPEPVDPEKEEEEVVTADMSWGEYSMHILKNHWFAITIGVVSLGLFIYFLFLFRRFRRYRKRIWEERDARVVSGEATLWDKITYLVCRWHKKRTSEAPADTDSEEAATDSHPSLRVVDPEGDEGHRRKTG